MNGLITNQYIYNPEGQLIGELDVSGNFLKTFIYASKSHVPDYFVDQNNERYKLIVDQLGSVRLVVKTSTGEIVQKMNHDEFGKVLTDTKPGFIPFGFAGGLYDSETKLVRFGARDYDPEIGRWTSKDPIRFNGGDANLYGYVLQDPVNGIDPSGKITQAQFNGGLQVVGGGLQAVFGGAVVVVGNFGAVAGGAFIAGPTLGIATVPALAVTLGISNVSNNIGGNFVNSGIDNILGGIQQIKGPVINQCK